MRRRGRLLIVAVLAVVDGGYVAQAGFAILLLGVAASSSFATAVDRPLRPGESAPATR